MLIQNLTGLFQVSVALSQSIEHLAQNILFQGLLQIVDKIQSCSILWEYIPSGFFIRLYNGLENVL